jgi:transcription elongation factor Elf1
MIIFCDECGERYVIEGNDAKEKVAAFKCSICHTLIKVSVPEDETKNQRGSESPKD